MMREIYVKTKSKSLLLVSLSLAILILLTLSSAQPIAAQSYDCSSQNDIPISECQALVDLYNSTNGPNWTDNRNWLITEPCSFDNPWFGVSCSVSSGHVRGLWLHNNRLSGSIPSTIGNLTDLEVLYLLLNQLSGSIPSTIGNLTKLQELELHINQLSGGIPPTIGNLASLQQLILSNNQLSGSIPPTIGNLASLQELYLDNNQLSGSLPPELGNLTQLDNLVLSDNRLSGNIPPTIGNLINLRGLQLSHNPLSGELPASMMPVSQQGLINLIFLNIDYTCLIEPQDAAFQNWLKTVDYIPNYHPLPDCPADLWIEKTDSPDPALFFESLTYTLVVGNNGPDTATNVTVSDTLPPDVRFESATPSQGSCSEQVPVMCNLGSLPVGDSVTITIVVIPKALEEITNSAEVSSDKTDPNTGNNTVMANTEVICGVPNGLHPKSAEILPTSSSCGSGSPTGPLITDWGPFEDRAVLLFDSDEKLELECVDANQYGLFYTPPGGGIGDRKKVGKCPFLVGCNIKWLFYSGNKVNIGDQDKPDCLISTRWISKDYGYNDILPNPWTKELFENDLDWAEMIFNPRTKHLDTWDHKWTYLIGPPLPFIDENGNGILEPEEPNYCTKKPELVELQPGLPPRPEGVWVNSFPVDTPPDMMGGLLSHQIVEPLQTEGPMMSSPYAPCDFDSDSDCDAVDFQFFQTTLDLCRGDANYHPIADFDGDGCVTLIDQSYLFSKQIYLPIILKNSP
jgi:uncharacterized repeat protein (TIGR01451 family)